MEPDVPDPGSPRVGRELPGRSASRTSNERVDDKHLALAAEVDAFYRHAVPRITAVLVRKGAPLEQAAEAAHVALIRATRSWTVITTNRLSWCITTAMRYHLDRKFSAESSYDDIPPDSPVFRDPAPEVIDRVMARLRVENVSAKMSALTDRQREVLDLHLAGLTTTEIAAHQGCAEPTVRVHLTNIRCELDSDPNRSER